MIKVIIRTRHHLKAVEELSKLNHL